MSDDDIPKWRKPWLIPSDIPEHPEGDSAYCVGFGGSGASSGRTVFASSSVQGGAGGGGTSPTAPRRTFRGSATLGGWIEGWVVDGLVVEQHPQMRLDAGRELTVRSGALALLAVLVSVDDRPANFRLMVPLRAD